MFISKKVIITGTILSVIAGTSVFADDIARITGSFNVKGTQNLQSNPGGQVEQQETATEEDRVQTTPIDNNNGTTGVSVNTSINADIETTIGLNNVLQREINANASAHIDK